MMKRLTLLPGQGGIPDSPGDPRVRSLESRLEDGYARIEQAQARGEDVMSWEEFWIGLLRQYERVATSLPEAV